MSGLGRSSFSDPVGGAQACFRAVLDAMSHPGTVRACGEELCPPAPLGPAAAAVLLTLVDADTPLWLDPAARAASDWIVFHCGAPLAEQPGNAAFGLACTLPPLRRFAPGTHEMPETSATLVVQIRALGRGRRYRLSGPGIAEAAWLEAEELPPGFVADWQANRARFPLGVDLVLCAGSTLCALPRSVTVEES